MPTRSLRRRLALPATLAVSMAGAGAAMIACHGDEHPVPDAPVGMIPNRDAGVDAADDAAIDATPDATPVIDAAPVVDAAPPDAVAIDAMPDAEPMG